MRKERLKYWLIEHMITATDLGGGAIWGYSPLPCKLRNTKERAKEST